MNTKKLWKVLIADDDKDWVNNYKKLVEDFVGGTSETKSLKSVVTAKDGEAAWKLIEEHEDINVVVADVCMNPNCSDGYPPSFDYPNPFGGIWLVREIKKLNKSVKGRDIRCILISDKDVERFINKWLPKDEFPENFVKYVEKDISNPQKFKDEFYSKTCETFVEIAKPSKIITSSGHYEIIAESSKMKEVMKMVNTVSYTKNTTNTTVLILGESGTGKELIAKIIHYQGPRKDARLISINCGALAETLLESEIFGHEKGSFTGAIYQKKGKFELADKGTIFLDEVGEMSAALQVKLLRVLEEGEFERVGGEKSITVDVRVIAATNTDLKKAIEEKTFREDLYYRLNVVPIEIPPLRERKDDIPPLIEYFLKEVSASSEISKRVRNVKNVMLSYNWPGNLRELKNLIERAVVLNNEQAIVKEIEKNVDSNDSATFDTGVINIPDEGVHLDTILKKQKKAYIVAALKKTNGNITQAAELLHDKPRNISRYCNDLDLKDFIESRKQKD